MKNRKLWLWYVLLRCVHVGCMPRTMAWYTVRWGESSVCMFAWTMVIIIWDSVEVHSLGLMTLIVSWCGWLLVPSSSTGAALWSSLKQLTSLTLCWAVPACAASPFFSSCFITAYLCSFTLSVRFHQCTLCCSPSQLKRACKILHWSCTECKILHISCMSKNCMDFIHCSFLRFSWSRILHSHQACSKGYVRTCIVSGTDHLVTKSWILWRCGVPIWHTPYSKITPQSRARASDQPGLLHAM